MHGNNSGRASRGSAQVGWRMQISLAALEEFIALYRDAFGEELRPDLVLQAASRLSALYDAIACSAHSSQAGEQDLA
jgi:hypothetical protein